MNKRDELIQDIWNNLIAIPRNKNKKEFQLSPAKLREIVYKHLNK